MIEAATDAGHTAGPATRHVCIVDDDPEVRALLTEYLTRNGLRVGAFADGQSLRRFLARIRVDLVILDVMLPTEDGLAICRRLKAETDVPVMLLTARADEIDRVIGLELGADDYVCKPFSPRELLARIRNLLRLAAPRHQGLAMAPRWMHFHGRKLDTARRVLESDTGKVQRLSGGEYALLYALASHANRVLSRQQLARLTHGRDMEPSDRGIDMLVSRLRQLLGDNARDPQIICTVYGRGYVFNGAVTRE